ncbi:phosphoadenylyl-sulfate reductase [Actibacterium sp. 188UL27-1]|uniref:phosphoadenylyl-sulfate reductase n=1 Tax=Actibacterium sp. 188UL27-1 TaxID=2786961 RepID=UPI001956D5D6|nr:phosphoadenylyl-sulfate reductase [Actibacterium sp. 188UL27-1]MBM7070252.1 phosphoadenylyl-sulfate reductase [Actibacterium sp. 188UL27-1]
MPLDHGPSVTQRAGVMNHYALGLTAEQILAEALENPYVGRTAVVSSFGADAVVLLDLVARVAPWTPVLFIDTRMMFAETLEYQQQVAAHLGLQDVRVIRARHVDLVSEDPGDMRHKTDPDGCCDLRKTRPLNRALGGFDAWITGRKRHQSGSRAGLKHFEAEAGRIKINPLADWSAADVRDHIVARDLPRHPLVAQGYPSIGCLPCTSPVRPGEDARAGRWRDADKEECGIHFVDGKVVRGSVQKEA